MPNQEVKVFIENKEIGQVFEPMIEGDITVEWDLTGSPGKMTFNVVKDDIIDYQEGNSVVLMIDGEIFYYGYVFDKSRNKRQVIKTVCYDQIRYLKNKDTFQYTDMTYGELLERICKDRHLLTGEIADTKYKIAARTEQNKEYYSMLMTASDLTTANTGEIYNLHDHQGRIRLMNIKDMRTSQVIEYDTLEDFDYSTSISENSFNRVKILLIDDETNESKIVSVEDEENIARWGLLQYFQETNNEELIEEKAKILLRLFNRKTRRLKLTKQLGDKNVRAGSLVPVKLHKLGDIDVDGFMLVSSVVHTFSDNLHLMDLNVYNKDIMPAFTGKGLIEDVQRGNSYAGTSTEQTENFVSYATSKVGYKYSKARRMAPDAYDCSSLVLRSMRAAGLDTTGENLTSRSIHTDSRFIEINKSQLQRGDVLWSSGHVAIYLGDGKTVEAVGENSGVAYRTMRPSFKRFYRIKGA